MKSSYIESFELDRGSSNGESNENISFWCGGCADYLYEKLEWDLARGELEVNDPYLFWAHGVGT